MIAVPHSVILEKELARKGSIGVQRDRRSAIQLRVGEGADRRRGCPAVALEQIQRRVFCRGILLPEVLGIDLVDSVPGYAGYRLARGKRLGQLDFNRIHARDVMHDDADLAPILRDTSLPLRIAESACEGGKRVGPLFEASGKGLGSLAQRLNTPYALAITPPPASTPELVGRAGSGLLTVHAISVGSERSQGVDSRGASRRGQAR
jgi:hypothetical protein